MFDKFIDVSKIMREVKLSSNSYDDSGRMHSFASENNIKGYYSEEIEKRNNKLLEYRESIDQYRNIGTKIPQFLKFSKVKRTILKIVAKMINKVAFIITRDQNIVNNFLLLSIDRLREDISLLLNSDLEERSKNDLIEETIKELKSKLDNMDKQFQKDKQEMIDIFEKDKQEIIKTFEKDKQEIIKTFEYTKNEIESMKQSALKTQEDTKKSITRMQGRLHYTIRPEIENNIIVNSTNDNDIKFENDKIYSDFEENFRGSEIDIKDRLDNYIKVINEYNGLDIINCLDIGCGRGEFLELLRENGFNSTGVDINNEFVAVCQAKGLNVQKADGLNYLKTLEDNSLDLITGFQIIEHIEVDELNLIINECRRVLKENGLLIFETPNPQNLIVGACNFYLDSTHIRPVHPERIKFQMETFGFYKIEYFYWDNRVKEYRENMKQSIISSENLSESAKGILLLSNEWFNSSPDFAIIGRKA